MIKHQRLSRLQRFILTRCYANMVKRGSDPKDASVSKFEIYRDHYHLPCHTGKSGYHVKAFFESSQRVKIVTLSRSLASLYRRNLIYKTESRYAVVLTDAGILKAKELLNLKY